MSESILLSRDDREQFQQRATKFGMSLLGFESGYWGNEAVDQWVNQVWAVIDEQSEDAFHLAAAFCGNPREDIDRVIQPLSDDWVCDAWVPKSKSDILVMPEWTVFEGEGTRQGTVYATLEKRDKYGLKTCLWGDTYEALSDGQAGALEGYWEALHPTFDGDCWVIDEVNGIVISEITDAGYDLKIRNGLCD